MAYSTVPTSRVGDLIDASWMNTYMRDDMTALGTHAHIGATGDGSATLDSIDHVDLDQTGSGLSEPAADHVRFAANTDGTLRFRANGATEKTVSAIGHSHSL
jgi:hypothetical protein